MNKLKDLLYEKLEDYIYWERQFRNPEKVLKKKFKTKLGYELNLENPRTFNEKLQWLKLYDHNSQYTNLVDKYLVRKFIKNTIGEKYLIPLIAVYNSVDEIDFEKLPNQFVLKCTHDSGGVIICKDKNEFDEEKAKKKLKKLLKRNFYYAGFEWPYKNIVPRIICEKYMVDESGYELKDYKFFCFNGEPKALFIASDRGKETKFDFFDIDFKKIDVKQHYENSMKNFNKPIGFNEMVSLAKTLSKDIPHVRIDFYDINGNIYFGEMTFYHFSGYEKFEPNEFDILLGNWIQLPNKGEKRYE